MIEALQIADARQISRDMLLRDMNANLEIRTYDYDHGRGKSGVGMCLMEIKISAVTLLNNALNFKLRELGEQ